MKLKKPSVYCDTSFLFSLYGSDGHTSEAVAIARKLKTPLCISKLNDFELGNALRFSEFRALLKPGEAAAYLADFQQDLAASRLIDVQSNLAEVLEEAMRLSAKHTCLGGHRSFDVLHVAAALHGEASTFLTFDENQKKLAALEGLKTN